MKETRFWIELSQWDATGIKSGSTNFTEVFEKCLNHGVVSGQLTPRSLSIKVYFEEPTYKPSLGHVIYSVNELNTMIYFRDNYDTSD